jgi:general nucleoside transport system permease protein
MTALAARLFTPGRLRVLLAIGGAVLVLNLASFAFGQPPVATLARAFSGTWGTPYGVGQVLFKATPLLFTGLAFHVALRAGLFNIGTEGQLAMASLGATWLATKLPASWPRLVVLPIVLATAIVLAAGWASIAGLLRARRGVHEIISTIMLNKCADVLLPWALALGIASDGVRTTNIPPGAQLTRLDRYVPELQGSAASSAFLLALAVTFRVWRWLGRSREGREMAWIGQGASACEAQGIDVPRRRFQAMALSGGLAGLAVAGTVLGYKGYYELGLGAGAGFSGIAVAMVGRGGPVQLVAAALLFGTFAQAGLAINARVPRDAMGVIEAVVILLMGAVAYAARDRAAQPVDAEPVRAPEPEADSKGAA